MSEARTERDRITSHALAYPFNPPGHSFRMHTDASGPEEVCVSVFEVTEFGDGIAPLVNVETIATRTGGKDTYCDRVPVIAAGSNASFQRLTTKFTEIGLEANFPVLLVRIADLVPVYSAHISKYGSIPGTLTSDLGATSLLHIAFLAPEELRRVNESEALGLNYGLALLEKQNIDLGDGHTLNSVCAYVSRRGAFAPDGNPVRIDAFSVERSLLPLANQPQILGQLHRMIELQGSFEEFIHAHVENSERRTISMQAMQKKSLPCAINNLGWIEGEPDGRQSALPDTFGYCIEQKNI